MQSSMYFYVLFYFLSTGGRSSVIDSLTWYIIYSRVIVFLVSIILFMQHSPSSVAWKYGSLSLSIFQDVEGETRREAASREAANRVELRAKLAGLPQPENEYEVSVPELPDADEKDETIQEDAADLALRRKREAAEREQAELKKRSQAWPFLPPR